MEDEEAEIYEGIRANFPLSFGKQSKSQTPLETLHKSTIRPTNGKQPPSSSSDYLSNNTDTKVFPSLSSSSKAWLDSLKKKNPNPRAQVSDDVTIGPPRPPPNSANVEEAEKGELIGPPRPPPHADDEEDDGPIIGPPRPPMDLIGSDTDDEDGDLDGEVENRYPIPISNEIVLKGHTKNCTQKCLFAFRPGEDFQPTDIILTLNLHGDAFDVVGFMSMTAAIAEASTSTFWCSKASKLN